MNKSRQDKTEQIKLLEEQVAYLNKEKQALFNALEMAVNLSNFQTSLNKIENPEIILKTTASRAQTVIRFKAICFYLVNEEDSSLYQAYCDPQDSSARMENEVNALIDDKTVSWALRRNKPTIVSSTNRLEQIMLQPLNTASRTRGMFVGLLGQDRKDISDISLILFTIAMLSAADALESFNLYGQIKNINKELIKTNEQLQRDIARREEVEAQLVQAQKMEAIGRLAGGVAHDFNNILTGILGYGSLLDLQMDQDSPLKSHLEQILKSARNAVTLTQSLLAFSRKQLINLKPLDLNKIVEDSAKLLSRLIGEDIETSFTFTDKELTIMADNVQIEQILMNLATNARDAMPSGGKLVIRTELARIESEFINTYGYGKEGHYALISVEDTGTGMDEETRTNIFEPFFTTKGVGKGTGLGLSSVYGIVKQHNGYIVCESQPGKGTTFNVYLPLVDVKAEEIQPPVITPVRGGIETVLVADDDVTVRTLIQEVLKTSGYTVLEAVDGEDAVNVFRKHKDKIELLILDVVMPKKNGREAYEEMAKIKPRAKAIFASGYTADIVGKKGAFNDGVVFMSKPIVPDKLLQVVRETLDK